MLLQITTKIAKSLTKLADERHPNSLTTRLREKRFSLFNSFLEQRSRVNLTRVVRIIDVGGTPIIWEKNLLLQEKSLSNSNFEIIVANLKKYHSNLPHIKCCVSDAKNMKVFGDKEFDMVFSNSLIEHVGEYNDQLLVANEIMRIGKTYFVQTPNFYFPIEPHFLFPFFQFLPLKVKVWLLTNFDIGWRKKAADPNRAINMINSIKLLRKQQLIELFPGGTIFEEKFFGLTKSFIVYGESKPLHPSRLAQ